MIWEGLGEMERLEMYKLETFKFFKMAELL